ncbi:hypothetical protein EVAR_83387_1 [Eumeta japonica]|uniref:Uncharacterized protein n=1 Tax=Eumeta variegata TaxID=151549 RepID=A0A4C1TYE8_EUMVA|nr:hypothetical protein EVAR_83387_1 [Eumeta japonica]
MSVSRGAGGGAGRGGACDIRQINLKTIYRSQRRLVKVRRGRRNVKVESMQWICDICVVCVVFLKNKRRAVSDVRERCGLKESVVPRVKKGGLAI